MKYYLQDKRSWARNIMFWWKRGDHGYTTDLKEAKVWEAKELEDGGYNAPDHPKYEIWEKKYIDSLVMKVVDQRSAKWDRAGIKKFKYNCYRASKKDVDLQTDNSYEVDVWMGQLEFGEGREIFDENGNHVEEFLTF